MGNLQIGQVLLMAIVQLTYGSVWPKDNITVVEDQPFVAYIVLPKSFGDVVNCSFKFEDGALISVDTLPISTSRGEWIYKIPENVCGIRVAKLSVNSAGNWILIATNITEDTISEKVTVNMVTKKVHKNYDTFKTLMPGPTTIYCSLKNSYNRCRMSDEDGKQWNICKAVVNIQHSTAYKCESLDYDDKPMGSENIYVSIGNKNEQTRKTVVETENSLVLTCKFPDPILDCKVELPNKSITKILPNRDNGDGYKTAINNSYCSIEIPKPLEPINIGIWTISDTLQSLDNTGCMFYIGDDYNQLIKKEVAKMKKNHPITTFQDGDRYTNNPADFEITCKAPVVVKQCYLKSPLWGTGDITFPDQVSFDRTKNVGKCVFKKLKALTGTWTCGILGEGFDEEIIQTFQVDVKSTKGEAVISEYRVNEGNTIELLCKSPLEQPITNCVYISPGNKVYIPKTDASLDSRISYFGAGLDQGQCGILIENLQSTDFGRWTCRFSMASSFDSVSEFNIYVNRRYNSMDNFAEFTATLMAGVSLFALVLLALIWYLRRKCGNYSNVRTNQENSK